MDRQLIKTLCSRVSTRCSPRYQTSHHSNFSRFDCSLALLTAIIFSSQNPVQENRDPAYVLVLTIRTAIDSWLSSTWGLAAIAAYRAYKDPSSLRYAQSIWIQLTAFLVTPEDAASGTHPMRSVNISGMCHGGELSNLTTLCHINIQHLLSYYCWCGICCMLLIHRWIDLW